MAPKPLLLITIDGTDTSIPGPFTVLLPGPPVPPV